MKILITGGLGLIGHHVVKKFEALFNDVVIIDNKTNYGFIPRAEIDYLVEERSKGIKTRDIYDVDIADAVGVEWIFRKHKPDLVVHLASFPRQKAVNANPALGARTMSEGLLNLLECSKQYEVDRFFYISSSMVYGDFTDDVREDAVCNPIGQYGIMKLAGEWLVKDYQRRGIDYTIFRPSAVYGPLDVEDRVISKFLLTALRGQTLKVNGPEETLDFTFVDDCANGIVSACITDATRNKIYNITKSHSKTLLAAAELAVKLTGKGSILVQERDMDFPSRGALNIDAARRDFGFDPKVDIDEGFQYYLDWLRSSSYWKKDVYGH